ncbi:hypothetical protein [Agrococcus sp. Ld7]|uniref:hypothetical protein n=1 Tax=Agrococcus sp. Ld7 TaxID=649148 RepID=UPI00386734C3
MTAYIDSMGGVAPDPASVGAPFAAFEPPAALSGLDVECTVTFVAPGNGEAGSRRVSFAVVEDDPAGSVTAALTAYVAANGYVSDEDHPDGGDGFEEWQVLEEDRDIGLYAAEWLHFNEIDAAATATGYEAMALAHTDADPGDWVVVNINERR